jgi:two-component system cell cycle response regulator DivK
MIVEDNELNMKLFHDLLMDIQLPEVSGLEVTKWLKEDPELKAIPVVAVTAFAMRGDEERIRESGCEAYLSKPVPVAQFIDTVRSFLGLGLSMPAFSQPAAVGALPSPCHNIVERRAAARRKTTEIADQWAQALRRARRERPRGRTAEQRDELAASCVEHRPPPQPAEAQPRYAGDDHEQDFARPCCHLHRPAELFP